MRLGPPPADPRALRAWNARLLAEVQWLAIRGEIAPELAATIRANSGAIDRALPAERARPDDDEDEDGDQDGDDGPELVDLETGGEAIRVEVRRR